MLFQKVSTQFLVKQKFEKMSYFLNFRESLHTSSSPHWEYFMKFNHGVDGNDNNGSENRFWNVIKGRH